MFQYNYCIAGYVIVEVLGFLCYLVVVFRIASAVLPVHQSRLITTVLCCVF